MIEQTYQMPLEAGLKIELNEFVKCVVSDTSKNLISLFYISEELKKGPRAQSLTEPPEKRETHNERMQEKEREMQREKERD